MSERVVDPYGIEREEREVISVLRRRHEGEIEVVEIVPTYTAVGFAHDRVERMLNPGRAVRDRRFE